MSPHFWVFFNVLVMRHQYQSFVWTYSATIVSTLLQITTTTKLLNYPWIFCDIVRTENRTTLLEIYLYSSIGGVELPYSISVLCNLSFLNTSLEPLKLSKYFNKQYDSTFRKDLDNFWECYLIAKSWTYLWFNSWIKYNYFKYFINYIFACVIFLFKEFLDFVLNYKSDIWNAVSTPLNSFKNLVNFY